MYIVISNPKRISVKSGLVHMVRTSGTVVDLLLPAGAARTGGLSICNTRAKSKFRGPDSAAVKSFNKLSTESVSRAVSDRRMLGESVHIDRSVWSI